MAIDLRSPKKGQGADDDLVLSSSELAEYKANIAAAVAAGDPAALDRYEELLVDAHIEALLADSKQPAKDETPSYTTVAEAFGMGASKPSREEVVKIVLDNKRFIEEARSKAVVNYETKTGSTYIPSRERDNAIKSDELEDVINSVSANGKITTISQLEEVSKAIETKKQNLFYTPPLAMATLNDDGTYTLGDKNITKDQMSAMQSQWSQNTGNLYSSADNKVYKADRNDETGETTLTDPKTGEQILADDETLAGLIGELDVLPFADSPAGLKEAGEPTGLIYIGDDEETIQRWGGEVSDEGTISIGKWQQMWDNLTDEDRAAWDQKMAELGFSSDSAIKSKQNWVELGGLLSSNFDEGTMVDPDTMIDELAARPGVGGNSAETLEQAKILEITDDIYSYAYNNGIQLNDDALVNHVSRVVDGGLDPNEIKKEMREDLANTYPALAERIRSGADVKTIASPYLTAMGNILEIDADGIDVNDPTIQRALSAVDEKGQPTTVPIWKFREMLMKDNRYYQTDNARNTYASMAADLRKTFTGV